MTGRLDAYTMPDDEKKTPTSGCWDCYGISVRWRGKNAQAMANAHAAESGHAIWSGEIFGPKRTLKPPAAPRKVPEAPKATVTTPAVPPLPKARLSKRRMCDGKVAHRSAAGAQKAIDNTPGDREFLNVYQCLYCGKYHVGHIIRPEKSR